MLLQSPLNLLDFRSKSYKFADDHLEIRWERVAQSLQVPKPIADISRERHPQQYPAATIIRFIPENGEELLKRTIFSVSDETIPEVHRLGRGKLVTYSPILMLLLDTALKLERNVYFLVERSRSVADLAETLVKLPLAALYFFIALGNFLNIAINPEAYLLFFKLGGLKATLYLVANGSAALILLALIIRLDPRKWTPLSLAYFAFHLANSIIISTEIFKAPAFSTISLIGLILSLIPVIRGLARR